MGTGRRRAWAALAAGVAMTGVAVAGVAAAGPARAGGTGTAPGGPGTGAVVKDSQPDPTWAPACTAKLTTGCYRSLAVRFPSRRSGATLAGTLYGPPGLDHGAPVPAVVVIPPSGGAGTQGSVSYLAKYLAVADGFVALTVDPQGVGDSESLGRPPCDPAPGGGRTNPSPCPNVPFQQMDNFFDAGQSALDFLLGPHDTWRAHVDPHRIGAAGHSEGARAATYLQDPAYDGRVGAVVALDNLTTNYCGDAGTPSNEGPGGSTGAQNALINGQPECIADPHDPSAFDRPSSDPRFRIRPVAPALGLASDGPAGLGYNSPSADPAPAPTQGPPGEKETAYQAWKAAGVPSGELVLAGVTHLQFSQTSTSDLALLHRVADYTAAWFALWLGHDAGAVASFASCSAEGEALSSFLSSYYLSSVFIPPGPGRGGLSIDDLRSHCGG